jgi:4-amino-4-deoxy-L-arabinose transferase-like glycosyltransferase
VVGLAVCVYALLPSARPLQGYDEHIYGTYVRTLNEQGVKGLRTIARAWRDDPRLNKGPLPFRVAYVAAGAAACRLLGGDTLENLASVSAVFGILTVAAAAWLLGRWATAGPAFLASLLVVASPLLLGLSRRALQDTMLAFLLVLAFGLFDRAWREGRKSDAVWLAVVLTLGWMTKESMFFLQAVFAAMAVYYGCVHGWRGRWLLLPAFIAPPVLYFAVCSVLAGGTSQALETLAAYGQQQSHIPYARAFQQGPWYRYLADFLLMSPLTFVLAIFGCAHIGRSRLWPRASLAALILATGLLTLSVLPLMNLRLAVCLDIPLRFLAAVGIFAMAQRLAALTRARPESILVVLAAVAILADMGQFVRLYVVGGLYDPVTAELMRLGGFVR